VAFFNNGKKSSSAPIRTLPHLAKHHRFKILTKKPYPTREGGRPHGTLEE